MGFEEVADHGLFSSKYLRQRRENRPHFGKKKKKSLKFPLELAPDLFLISLSGKDALPSKCDFFV